MQKIVSDLLRKWDLHPYLWNILLPVTCILIGILLYSLLKLFVKKRASSTGHLRLGQSIFRHLSGPVAFLLPWFLFDNVIPLLQAPSSIKNRVTTATEVALIICFSWFLIRFIRVIQDIVHHKININTTNNLRQRQILTQLMYIRQVMTAVIVLLTIGAVLLTFDAMRKIGTGLLTGVGIGGIIIGFAAQRSLGNLLAGFQIAFTQPIRIDDEVIVEGEFGKVEELTLTYVVIRIWDNRRLVLPINYFIEKPFQNWTRTTADIIGTVYLYADYSLPVEWVRNEFKKIIDDHPLWDKKTAGIVVTDLKPDVVELRAIISTRNSGDSWDLRCYVREEIIKRISANYPQCLPKFRAEILKDSEAS